MNHTRHQKIEDAVARTFQGLREGSFDEFPPEHLVNVTSKSFDLFSRDGKFKIIELILHLLLPDVPDLRDSEIRVATESYMTEHQFKGWIFAQLDEIGERFPGSEDETFGELLVRAAAAGDQPAIKLLEMGIGGTRM